MSVLTRKIGTEIVIDGRIRVAVLKIGRGQVQLGVSAPANVPIFRRELLDKPDSRQSDKTLRPVPPSSRAG